MVIVRPLIDSICNEQSSVKAFALGCFITASFMYYVFKIRRPKCHIIHAFKTHCKIS